MIIAGAKGFAKELLQVLCQLDMDKNISFFDDISSDLPDKLYGKFPIFRSVRDVGEYFRKHDSRYAIGVGKPKDRFQLYEKMNLAGGELVNVISPKSEIGNYNTNIGKGVNVLTAAIIENDVIVGDACLIGNSCIIGHDTKIGAFTEISPGVIVSGRCKIGCFCSIGAGSVILPDISIGDNVIIGAGSVVTKNLQDGCTVMGVPAKRI